MKTYLSGPMTGLPDLNFPAFHDAAKKLRDYGVDVVNPAELNPEGTSWGDCMRRDITELVTCHTILMLKGWEKSEGAKLELHIAQRLGMGVVYQEDDYAMKQAFTPGPWVANEISPESCKASVSTEKTESGKFCIATIQTFYTEEANATARLIAAAPDLLECLQELLILHLNHHNWAAHVKARAAITKALEGKA